MRESKLEEYWSLLEKRRTNSAFGCRKANGLIHHFLLSSLGSQLRKSRTALARHYHTAFDFPCQMVISEPKYGTSEGENSGAKRQRWASEGEISAKKTDNLSCEPNFGLPISKFRNQNLTRGAPKYPSPHQIG